MSRSLRAHVLKIPQREQRMGAMRGAVEPKPAGSYVQGDFKSSLTGDVDRMAS
jgi:hypothetical protein